MRKQVFGRWSISRPSTPAAPLLALARFHARFRFSLTKVCSSSLCSELSDSFCGRLTSALMGPLTASPRPISIRPALTEIKLTGSHTNMAYHAFSGSALRQKRLLRPLLTSRSGWRLRPFRHNARYLQARNTILHRTTARFTLLSFDHKSFAVTCPLALVRLALNPVPVHQLTASIHAGSPHSVALMQLRFTSFAVASLTARLSSARLRPYWAHTKKGDRSRPFFGLAELSSAFPFVHGADHQWWSDLKHQLPACAFP